MHTDADYYDLPITRFESFKNRWFGVIVLVDTESKDGHSMTRCETDC